MFEATIPFIIPKSVAIAIMMLLIYSPFTTIMGSFIASNMLLLYNGVSDRHLKSDSNLYDAPMQQFRSYNKRDTMLYNKNNFSD